MAKTATLLGFTPLLSLESCPGQSFSGFRRLRFDNLPPIMTDPIASNTGLPVYEVSPRQPVASTSPATAAPSSIKTVTALGSRPLTTEKEEVWWSQVPCWHVSKQHRNLSLEKQEKCNN